MNRRLTALMLPLIGLFLAVIGLARVQKVWKPALVIVAVAGAVIWWIIYFNLLSQSLW